MTSQSSLPFFFGLIGCTIGAASFLAGSEAIFSSTRVLLTINSRRPLSQQALCHRFDADDDGKLSLARCAFRRTRPPARAHVPRRPLAIRRFAHGRLPPEA